MSQPRDARRPPWLVLLLALVGVSLFALPVAGLLWRTPWNDLGSILRREVVTQALGLSLVTSVAATLVSVVLGVPVAWLLARVEFRGRSLVRGLVMLPLVLPPVVGGAALLFALGRRGLVGPSLESIAGVVLPFSIWGVIIATTFVSMPFLVITVEGALRNLDIGYEKAASSLGAKRWRVLSRVTLPMIWPSVGAGMLLTWARAFGEFGATITFAGNLQGATQTMPLAVFVSLESDRDAAIAISLLMMLVALTVLVLLRGRWLRAS